MTEPPDVYLIQANRLSNPLPGQDKYVHMRILPKIWTPGLVALRCRKLHACILGIDCPQDVKPLPLSVFSKLSQDTEYKQLKQAHDSVFAVRSAPQGFLQGLACRDVNLTTKNGSLIS